MKKLIIFIAMLIVMVSCHNYKKDAQNLLVEKDSLLAETKTKDSSILDFVTGYNEIQANLDSIKKMENLVNLKSGVAHEITSGAKMLILEDIQIINDLLLKNKNQIISLQNKLKNSKAQADELEAVKIMLATIQMQNQEKDSEINKLSNDVNNLKMNMGQLTGKMAALESDNRQKEEIIEQQSLEINQVFYAKGSNRALKEEKVLEKVGGILGLGRTPVIADDFEMELFTSGDKRELNYVPLMAKKARLLSVHPTQSYHISGGSTADTLFIDNKNDFWKATKYLIVMIN